MKLTSLGDKRIGQSRFAVVNVSNDGHVSDIPGIVHGIPDIGNCEIHLGEG